MQDAKGKFVYIVDKDNTLQTQYFKDDGQFEQYWVVKEGLNVGDKFVSTGLTKLMPKMTVKVAENKKIDDKKAEEKTANGGEVK